MPFTLKVTQGAGAGAEFPFDTAEARLGRTADNDIVVKDAGASRSHARVYQKGARYFIEDMKSANGTKVNSALINAPKEIKTGDTITIGEVIFTFTSFDQTVLGPPPGDFDPGATLLKSTPADTGDTGTQTDENPAVDPNATLLKAPLAIRDVERERPTAKSRPVMSDLETGPPSKAPLKLGKGDADHGHGARGLAKRPSDALKQPTDGTLEVPVPHPVVRRGGGGRSDDGDDDELTAADKLRLRREANRSAMGRLRYGWQQMSKGARMGTGATAALFVVGVIGFVAWAVWPEKQQAAGPEPVELTAAAATIEHSFGLGEGVTFQRPDMKIFSFTAASATRIVGVLHYQAKDISKDEVAISINGFDLGFVAPDTLDTANRELELVLPAQQIKKGDANQVVFDNTRNPPGEDPWRIWNLWLELIAIPDMSLEETVNAVKEDLERSQKYYEQRDIGPDNLFKAWKGFRDAWLKLESLTGRPDELYIVARQQQREMAVLLDKRCNLLVLDFQKAMNSKKPDRKGARQVAEEILRYFPTREHRCHGLARELLEDLGGI